MKVKIELTPEECEEIFYSALCNALNWLNGYGLVLEYDENLYAAAKSDLRNEKPEEAICYEDVLMKMLRNGNTLTMVDEEDEGEYTRSITINEVRSRVAQTPYRNLISIIEETDDVSDSDAVLQTVWFEEIIFG